MGSYNVSTGKVTGFIGKLEATLFEAIRILVGQEILSSDTFDARALTELKHITDVIPFSSKEISTAIICVSLLRKLLQLH